ncbi:hypothetical protein M514_06071 [Trichuris suis]|uniref:G-protein coupled receptors family 1 profile domain-containing protein n=1 Tax=Trichuris suis TaxID=68888 RepID=A0A085NKC0_9BILA|nr:hypothetical protein M514_06071 [Trichuris suis]
MGDEIYPLNRSSNHTGYEQITTTIEISRLVFGIVGFALNIALLYTLLAKKPISTTNKLIATFSAGTSLSVLGSSIVISYRLLVQGQTVQMTAFDCFIWIPGIWIYLFGDQMTSQFTLLISIDYFLSLCILNPRWKITDKFAIVCICESLIAGCISVIITFINAHHKRWTS